MRKIQYIMHSREHYTINPPTTFERKNIIIYLIHINYGYKFRF